MNPCSIQISVSAVEIFRWRFQREMECLKVKNLYSAWHNIGEDLWIREWKKSEDSVCWRTKDGTGVGGRDRLIPYQISGRWGGVSDRSRRPREPLEARGHWCSPSPQWAPRQSC